MFTILFVSHDLNAVERFCDRVILLENGQIKNIGLAPSILDIYKQETATQKQRLKQSKE